MAICENCGAEFDLTEAKRQIGRDFGAGTYDDYYPNEHICYDCALEQISCDYAAGAEIIDLMGTGWDDDY